MQPVRKVLGTLTRFNALRFPIETASQLDPDYRTPDTAASTLNHHGTATALSKPSFYR
jgi:hypothetical protein